MGSSEKLLIMVGISLLVTLLVVGPALAIWENRRCLDFLSEAERAKVQQMAKAASAKHVGERSLEPVF